MAATRLARDSLVIMTGVGSLSQLGSTALSCQASARAACQADKIGSISAQHISGRPVGYAGRLVMPPG